MDLAGFVDILKDGLGFALPALAVIPALALTKAAVDKIEGAGDAIRAIGSSQGLKKRAGTEADFLRNTRRGTALNTPERTGRTGRALDFVTGRTGARRGQRRNLRYQDAEAGAKAGEAGFGVTDTKAADYIQSIAKSNAQVSAVNSANNAKFVSGIATGATSVGGGLGAADDPQVKNAIAAQQARAVADEIKNVELQANFPPDQLDKVREAMEDAIKNGDSIGARAYQNMLLNSGSKGIEEFRKGVGNAAPSGDMETSLKRNILTSHAGIKDTAADVGEYATAATNDSSGNRITLKGIGNDADTWKMADAKLVTQKGHSLEKAKATGAIDATQAKRIRDDRQLYGKLDPKGRAVIDSI